MSQSLIGPMHVHNCNQNAAVHKGQFYNVIYIQLNQNGPLLQDKPKMTMISGGERQTSIVGSCSTSQHVKRYHI